MGIGAQFATFYQKTNLSACRAMGEYVLECRLADKVIVALKVNKPVQTNLEGICMFVGIGPDR
jgi:hypothetical protein